MCSRRIFSSLIFLCIFYHVHTATFLCHTWDDDANLIVPPNCLTLCPKSSARAHFIIKFQVVDFMDRPAMENYTFRTTTKAGVVSELYPFNYTGSGSTEEIYMPSYFQIEKIEVCPRAYVLFSYSPKLRLTYRYISDAELAALVVPLVFNFGVGIIIFLTMVLMVVYSRKQPLKSRGGLPFINAGFMLIKLVFVQALNWSNTIARDQLVCLYILMILLHLFTQFGVLCNHVRYLLLIQTTKMKMFLRKSENNTGFARFVVWIVKFFNSIAFFATCMFLILVIIILAPFITYAVLSGCYARNSNETSYVAFYLVVCFLAYCVNCVIYLVIMFVDGLLNVKRLCDFRTVFIKRDPHCFRLEYILYLFSPITLLPALVIGIWAGVYLFSQSPDEFILYLLPGGLILIDFYYFIVMAAIPLALTIYQSWKTEKTTKDILVRSLENAELREKFKVHCELEFSTENILAYDDIQHYKTNPTHAIGMGIFHTYLHPNAPLPINVQGKDVQIILTQLNLGNSPVDLFEKIQKDLISNMIDTFSRFIGTSEYLEYKKKIELIQKI